MNESTVSKLQNRIERAFEIGKILAEVQGVKEGYLCGSGAGIGEVKKGDLDFCLVVQNGALSDGVELRVLEALAVNATEPVPVGGRGANSFHPVYFEEKEFLHPLSEDDKKLIAGAKKGIKLF